MVVSVKRLGGVGQNQGVGSWDGSFIVGFAPLGAVCPSADPRASASAHTDCRVLVGQGKLSRQ